jgi:D-alanine---(R)-lactate ligase
MPRITVAILFGGASDEHDISIKSATEIVGALDPDRYDPVLIGITRTGAWRLAAEPAPDWEEHADDPVAISPDRGVHGVVVDGRPRRIDAVIPMLHGATGEDGAIQGLLELAGIPYVGCDVAGSAVCIDKSLAYVVARAAGIATPGFAILAGPRAPVPAEIVYPVFVKPARSGSSLGVHRVESALDLDAAIADARRYDGKVLIEEAIHGAEVGCAVLGDGDDLVTGEVDRITLRHGFFRIHQEDAPEQGSENAVIEVPAPIPDETRDRVRGTARAIYSALGCRGLARVDMFLQDDGRILLNEVNTMPGFTSYSRYPRMMAAAGIGLPELIDRSIDLALAR